MVDSCLVLLCVKIKPQNNVDFSKHFMKTLEWGPERFHWSLFSTVRISAAWQRQTCFYFILCLNTLLIIYTPELRVTCGFWTGRSELLDLCALTSFIADGVRAFTSGCTVPGTDIARFALCWCTIWTLIARTCGARTSASCMRNKSYAEQTCCECIFLPSHRIAVNWVPNVLPLSILTATVLHVESLSIPKAEASTTLPKAPCPRVLPDRGKQYLVNGTAAELPVLQLHSQTVSYVLAAALKQHA